MSITMRSSFLGVSHPGFGNDLTADTMIADLKIGYGGMTETFASRVSLDRSEMTVDTVQESGPFRHLESKWHILDRGKNYSIVNFKIAFEFRSVLLESMMGAVFEAAAHKMIAAFEERAAALL